MPKAKAKSGGRTPGAPNIPATTPITAVRPTIFHRNKQSEIRTAANKILKLGSLRRIELFVTEPDASAALTELVARLSKPKSKQGQELYALLGYNPQAKDTAESSAA